MKKDLKSKELYANMTVPERIEHLQKELERLEKALPLYEYCNGFAKQKNSYVVEIRRVLAWRLKNQGYTTQEISKILCKNHATVLHLFNIRSEVDIVHDVAINLHKWIENKEYPMVRRKLIAGKTSRSRYSSVLDYYLKKIQ